VIGVAFPPLDAGSDGRGELSDVVELVLSAASTEPSTLRAVNDRIDANTSRGSRARSITRKGIAEQAMISTPTGSCPGVEIRSEMGWVTCRLLG
jgi:hypothetical protein